MQTTISNRIIRKLNPCYDPKEVIKDENEELPIKQWVAKYRNEVHSKEDIIWLLCNKLFMSDKDMRLFAIWCAREALKLVDNPDPRSINACDVAEKFANGEATEQELYAARAAALDAARAAARATALDAALDAALYAAGDAALDAAGAAARDAAGDAALAAARDATRAAAWDAAWDAARAAAWDAQIDKLLTYF